MRVDLRCHEGLLCLSFIVEPDDPIATGKVKMGRQTCQLRLPWDWNVESVHPDLLALSIILIIYPFAGKRISLPFGVSRDFHDYFKQLTRKELFPVDNDIELRNTPEYSLPALAYSGGVDSTAALTLLPRNCCAFFLDRVIAEGKPTLYKKEAAHFACYSLREMGHSVYMIDTDLEYVRNPVGFPVDVAVAIPALLLADYVGLDSIAFGTLLSAAYRYFDPVFEDYIQRLHFKRWGKLFEIVAMPFNQVTAGMTEYGTSKIVLNSPYFGFAQSCMRGSFQKPCMNCFKCFRKKLLEMIILQQKVDDSLLDQLFKAPEAIIHLSKFPAKHEMSFAYMCSRYKGDHPLMKQLTKKTLGDRLELSWYEKWYSPSIELLPDKYRDFVKKNISCYLDTMTEKDEKNMKVLNREEVLASSQLRRYSDEFAAAIKKADANQRMIDARKY